MPGWGYILILLAVVSVVSGAPYFVAGEDARRPESEAVLTPLGLPPGIDLTQLQEAQVEDVIDGDTIDVMIGGQPVRVRYYGVDTPERGDRCYREAVDRNETLIGSRVLLLPDARDEDSFDRRLRYIFLADGTSVDATLVAEGFGRAWRQDGRYRDEIIALEEEAKAAGRGCLWG
jgi:micrococcal nuclease